MQNRSTLQNGAIFGAPLALLVGVISRFSIRVPEWLSGPTETASNMTAYDVVHVCRCQEQVIEWPDVFQFLGRQLRQLINPDWVPLALNIVLTLNVILATSKHLKARFKKEVTNSSVITKPCEFDADQSSPYSSLFGPRERAVLQFEKAKLKQLNFKYSNEDSWILEEDCLLPKTVVKKTSNGSERTLRSPRTLLSNLSPSTLVTSAVVQVSTPQKRSPSPQSENLQSEALLPAVPESFTDSSLLTPKLKFGSTSRPPHSPRPPKSPNMDSNHAPPAVSISNDVFVLDPRDSSPTASSSRSNVKSLLQTPEHFSPPFHQPSPIKSSILKTEVTQEEVYSQPFTY
ncbi:LAME_0G17700g1_1 [Lachancea meyersii CBS 8951]|uniref:LAME_0G17700g1_1 n=1 Tax=Lachancea meyersii CBS 8951 TaxID=1266667 RepID=A0A1G4KBL1_9SACH|nr:LAME_0G17700g1_1 [Lachancea meyersii CBS 8951]